MDTKKIFTSKRMADIAEAYLMLQVAIREAREAFIETATKEGEQDRTYWRMFDLQVLNAARKVAKPDDYFPHYVDLVDLRGLAFAAFGEIETIDVTEHLKDSSEVLGLALAGKNPAKIGRERRRAQLDRDSAAIARVNAEEEAKREAKKTPEQRQIDEETRIAQGLTPRARTVQDLERRLSK